MNKPIKEEKKKLKISSYTQKIVGKRVINTHHEDIISDEYWTEHKNIDGTILKIKVVSI